MHAPLIALDIETDTSDLTDAERAAGYTARGLDPAITPITAIAVVGTRIDPVVLTGMPERDMLHALSDILDAADASTLATWNGAVFDLPFIDARARQVHVPLGLRLEFDPLLTPKYAPTPGYRGGYQAAWDRPGRPVPHAHLDVAYAMRDLSYSLGIPWSLKPVATAYGLAPVEVDRTAMHDLTAAELVEYVASDARVTLELAARLLTGTLGDPAADY